MNVIFLTMSRISGISSRSIYSDLLRRFRDEGHRVYIVTPHERMLNKPTEVSESEGVSILGVRTLNLQKTSVMEKGVGQLLVESQFKSAIKHYFPGVKFDLILYSTPPITFPRVIRYLKKRNPQAETYLLLKDIFPQNAVDLGMMSKTGVKGIIYRFFRRKEKLLYRLSDNIGCMSPANVEYVLKHNGEIDAERVEVAPNSVELKEPLHIDRVLVRQKYNLPTDCPVFIYGGNLGKPQGIPFIIDCLSANAYRTDCHFLIVGSGTEFPKVKKWWEEMRPGSVTVMDGLPKNEYDELVSACDVGLIFLDHRFTIPNYPSRLLSYLENKMPVVCATDPNTDIGTIAEHNGYGLWCESDSVDSFTRQIDKMISSDLKSMGEKGYEFLIRNYLVGNTYDVIMKHIS